MSHDLSRRPASALAGLGRRTLLTLRVHADAIALDPWRYLKAVAWRVRGLKVRSRNTIAPMIGRSPKAYALWICRNEPDAAPVPALALSAIQILPVIDCRAPKDGAQDTVDSLGTANTILSPVLIGEAATAAGRRIERPCQLADFVGGAGMWICPMRAGDLLAPGALARYAAAAATSKTALIYADDDLVLDGERRAPHFKPRWNPDLFEHHDYLTGSSILFVTRDMLTDLPDERWMESWSRTRWPMARRSTSLRSCITAVRARSR